MVRLWTAAATLSLLSLPAMAQTVETSTGERIARATCSECHQVDASPAGASPKANAPRFADVARMPSATDLSIRVFLQSPHASMPNVMLSPPEIESLAAYIMGLRTK